MNTKKIIVLGGGYAGVLTAKNLIKNLSKEIKKGEVEVTLVDKRPYHTLMTELHEVAFKRTEAEAVKIYHKKIFNEKKINLVLDEVTDINYDGKEIIGTQGKYKYDYLVEATGSTPAFFGIEGVEENSYTMWSYDDAIISRNKVIEKFTRAEKEPNLEKRREILTFVVAGAGFTGVEVVGELQEWIERSLIYDYPTLSMDDVSIHIIDGAPRILNAFGEKASVKGHKHMDKKNINIIVNSFISKITPEQVEFGDEVIKSDMIIWTSGVTCAPISTKGYEVQRGNRIPVDSKLKIVGQDNVYSLGDIMYYIPEGEEMPVPQMVENCEHAAPIVANNISREIKGQEEKKKDYNPTFHGAMACIGGRYGVAELKFSGKTLVLSGFFAMLVKHMINMLYFFTAAGLGKVWTYIKDEFFRVEGRRSILGANLSASSPSIYLVPLRIWLGLYWMVQGVPKLVHKIQGGWHAVCVDTAFLPTEYKEYGNFCSAVYPEGESEWEALHFGTDSAASATAAGDAAEATADTATETANAATEVAHQSEGILGAISDFFASLAPQPTDYGLAYDLHLLPDFLTDMINNVMAFSMGFMGSMEWLLELSFDAFEVLFGFLLVIGLFIPFAAIGLLILAIMIALGSFVSWGIIVEGIIFTIVGCIALIGIGGKDAQPISVDYFRVSWCKKRKKKKSSKK